MEFIAAKKSVLNRGTAPNAFLTEMVKWAKSASDDIFSPNQVSDIYNKVQPELGPYPNLIYRKAVMLEVMRVLAGFESSWDWKEGVDTSRLGNDTQENAEAGAWQVSYNARHSAEELRILLTSKEIVNGIKFQQKMKFDHLLAMEFVARLMRHNTKHNGPLYKDNERLAIRSSLRNTEHSIYPWLNRASVKEFVEFLT